MLRRLLVLASVAASTALPAAAEPSSEWARDGAAALRLVDAGPAAGQGGAAEARPGDRLAAIAIQLDPGWKTYWRQPGVSGVPPRFDFSGSINVAEARVGFPVPERLDDPDGVTNVYHGLVTLPVTVRPKDPGAPVALKLVADYGVCEQVCVPVRAEAALELAPNGEGRGAEADVARAAAAGLPKPSAIGAAGPLAVASVKRVAAPAGKSAVEIAVAMPAGAEPSLFAETGEGDFAPSPEAIGAAKDGATFRMTFDEPDLPKSGLRLTLAAGGMAVETPVSLDAIGAAR